MRSAYVPIGIAWLVIIGVVAYVGVNGRFTRPTDDNNSASSTDAHAPMTLELTSTEFEDGGTIPAKYTCDGEGLNPPLVIGKVPEGTVSLALTLIDPDVPTAVKADGMFTHWVLYHIPPGTVAIAPGESIGESGLNGMGELGYVSPCPPPQYEPAEHRYIFTLYALDEDPALESGVPLDELQTAIAGHVIGEAILTGRYRRE